MSSSRLTLNFSSLSKEFFPRTTKTAIKEEEFVLFCDNNKTHLLHTTRKKREREREKKKEKFCHGSSFKRGGGDAFKPELASERRRDATDHASRVL